LYEAVGHGGLGDYGDPSHRQLKLTAGDYDLNYNDFADITAVIQFIKW
jgi:hypothetical protein